MSKTNCIIICAGDATRWKNHLGVPKHLINIGGETLIERAVKLIHKYKTEDVDVNIVVKDLNDERYIVDGAGTLQAHLNPDNEGADKFLSSKGLWNHNGRTLVFYGDVWFSDDCMKQVMEHKGKDWIMFANKAECFVQSFYPKDLKEHEANLHKIKRAFKAGHTKLCGGWNQYRAMNGYDLNVHKIGDKFILIDDLTDDFDFDWEFTPWMRRYNNEKDSIRM